MIAVQNLKPFVMNELRTPQLEPDSKSSFKYLAALMSVGLIMGVRITGSGP